MASWGKLVEIIIIKITTVISATVKIIASTNNNNEVNKQKNCSINLKILIIYKAISTEIRKTTVVRNVL